jgi:hypothetical protein
MALWRVSIRSKCIRVGRGPACLGQFFFQNLDRAADAQHGGPQIIGLAFNLSQLLLSGLEFRFQLLQSVRQLFLHIALRKPGDLTLLSEEWSGHLNFRLVCTIDISLKFRSLHFAMRSANTS